MIYNDRGVFDYFRYVNDNMVAGIMEGKELGEDGLFYFHLVRKTSHLIFTLQTTLT